jgi:hypothetical protein
LLVVVAVVDGKLVDHLVLAEDLRVEMADQDLLEPQRVVHNLLEEQEPKHPTVMVEHYLVALNQDQMVEDPVGAVVDIMVAVLEVMLEMVNLAVVDLDM